MVHVIKAESVDGGEAGATTRVAPTTLVAWPIEVILSCVRNVR